MSSKQKQTSYAKYLAPTESSARKNIMIDPFYEETNFSSTTTFNEIDGMFVDHKYIQHTPSKGNKSRVMSSEKEKQYHSSSSKAKNRTSGSPEAQFFITKTSTYEGINRGNKSVIMNNSRSGIIETTKLTTTTYSPDAKHSTNIHDV